MGSGIVFSVRGFTGKQHLQRLERTKEPNGGKERRRWKEKKKRSEELSIIRRHEEKAKWNQGEKRGEERRVEETRGCFQLRMIKFVFCYIWSTASTKLFWAEAEEGWFGLSGRSDCSFQDCNWPRWVPTSAGSHRAGPSPSAQVTGVPLADGAASQTHYTIWPPQTCWAGSRMDVNKQTGAQWQGCKQQQPKGSTPPLL